jgi:hypothetical protein
MTIESPEPRKSIDDLLEVERENISCRRARQGLGTALPGQTIDDLDAVGLAFSGGGIRSASFNLGFLQGLANLKILRMVDYLSTVSGGGYIGGWFTAWIQRENGLSRIEGQLDPEKSRESEQKGSLKPEAAPIRFLRRHSNYLAPRTGYSSADGWVLWATYLRNSLINQMLFLPALVAILLLSRIILVTFHSDFSLAFVPNGGQPDASGTKPVYHTLIQILNVIAIIIGALWFVAALVAFWASASVFQGHTLKSAASPRQGSDTKKWQQMEMTPAGGAVPPKKMKRWSPAGFWKVELLIVWPLLVSALISCFVPASRQFLNEARGRGAPGVLESQWTEFWLIAGSPVVIVITAYLLAVALHWRWPGFWHIAFIVLACIFGGCLLYFATSFLKTLSDVGAFEIQDYVRARAAARIATFGPPLIVFVYVLTIYLVIGLLRTRLEEDLREWWSSVCGRLLWYSTAWLVIFYVSLYATSNLIWAGPWIQTAVSSGWLFTVIGGVLAGGSQRTGGGAEPNPFLDRFARIAPMVFLIGIIVGISLLLPFLVDDHPDWSGLVDRVYAFRKLDHKTPATKRIDSAVSKEDGPSTYERRETEERIEMMSEDDLDRYRYWLGMFHSNWENSHLIPLDAWLTNGADTNRTPMDAKLNKKAGPEMDEPKEPKSDRAKTLRSARQTMMVMQNIARTSSLPFDIIGDEKAGDNNVTLRDFEKTIASSLPTDDVSRRNTLDSIEQQLRKWSPRVKYELQHQDFKYLDGISPTKLPKELQSLVDIKFAKPSDFRAQLKKIKKPMQPLFRSGLTVDTDQYLTHLEHLAQKPILIAFDPKLRLLQLAIALGICVSVMLLSLPCIDVNLFSLNAIYGNRLIRAYLGASRGGERKPDPITGFDFADDMKMTDLVLKDESAYDGPYLIVNAALNLVHGEELSWQERKAESFVFTPAFCGSETTLYRPTETYAGGISLGNAITISGAAVSPNAGYHSSPAVTALLTIFNARLGAWIANPRREKHWRTKGSGCGTIRLMKELFGSTDDRSRFVYLSDGGHFENLGVYELVRRRCRYIIVCDAGADPLHEFFDLGALIRKVRIDFGYRIELEPLALDLSPGERKTRWHCSVGRIRYDDVVPTLIPGTLIYVKPSLTGDEPADVAEYAKRNVTFPHEPTSDQFFSESQLESYRALGMHIAGDIFREAIEEMQRQAPLPHRQQGGSGSAPSSPDDTPTLCEDERRLQFRASCRVLFSAVARRWLSIAPNFDATFERSTRSYTALQEALSRDARLSGLSDDIYPEMASKPSETAGEMSPSNTIGSAERHVMLRLIQTMELVWLDLDLEANYSHPLNRGWLDVFSRWTNTKAFRRMWPIVRSEFSQRFVNFCERQLGLSKIVISLNSLTKEQLDNLNIEFQSQWPSESLVERETRVQKQNGNDLKWSIGVSMQGGESAPAICGVAMLLSDRTLCNDPSLPQNSERCELFLWIRGAYRNSGNGSAAMNQIVTTLQSSFDHPLAIRVYLPSDELTGPGGKMLKAMWRTFYHNHDFRPIVIDIPESGSPDVLERLIEPAR